MAKYYPKSQIQINQYSNGEFEKIVDNSRYTGLYWKTSKGKYFTGATPEYQPSDELRPVTQAKRLTEPTSTLSEQIRTLPPYFLPTPTESDYKNGTFTRYFYRRINQAIFTEISQEDYNTLKQKNQKYDWAVTTPFTILWTITGDETTVQRTNQNMVQLLESRSPIELKGLSVYFKNNYLVFYKK
jgi:hypothetical protein